MRVCHRIIPDAYDWTENLRRTKRPEVYLARYEFREQVKREARGAAAVKKVKIGLGRDFRRTAPKIEDTSKIEGEHEAAKCERERRANGREVVKSKENFQDEVERTTELFRRSNLDEVCATSPSQETTSKESSNAEYDEWVDVDDEDNFDFVETTVEGIVLDIEDDWDVI